MGFLNAFVDHQLLDFLEDSMHSRFCNALEAIAIEHEVIHKLTGTLSLIVHRIINSISNYF